MKVILAYPYKKHAPDDEVDLPEAEARRLLNDGRARRPARLTAAAMAKLGEDVGRRLAAGLTETTTKKPTPKKRPRHDSGTDRSKEQ